MYGDFLPSDFVFIFSFSGSSRAVFNISILYSPIPYLIQYVIPTLTHPIFLQFVKRDPIFLLIKTIDAARAYSKYSG